MKDIEEFTQLSLNFNMSEFLCRCGKQFCNGFGDPELRKNILRNLDALISKLQEFRDKYCDKRPVSLISGIRCYVHNINSRGAKNSMHLIGCAADITTRHLFSEELLRRARKSKLWGGIGNYTPYGFVHLDIGIDREWIG